MSGGGGMPGAPGGPPGPDYGIPGGLPDAGDGNFRRGKWIAPLVLIVAAAGIAGTLFFVFKKDKEAMKPEDAAKKKQDIFLLPRKEQIPKWRELATSNEPLLEQDALIELGLLNDDQGIKLATDALKSKDHRITAVAAQVLEHYGSPAADGAKPALLDALKGADDSDEPQIVWALVTLKEPSIFDKAMDLYRKGHLTKVQRLGGGNAFEAKRLAYLKPLDEFAKLADDSSDSVRQLVATVLSDNSDPKWTPILTKLVKDKSTEVAREAAVGLGKIGDTNARDPLLAALKTADKDSRQKFLDALRDGIGGEGLVLALDSVDHSKPETEWGQTKEIMERIRLLADPDVKAADALVKWVEAAKPHPHWYGEVGMRLAEIGDIRAAKYLAQRLSDDPQKIYKVDHLYESDAGGLLAKGDSERMAAARMLADLASVFPDRGKELNEAAYDAIETWTKNRAEPSASALRFYSTTKSEKALPQVRDWAFPKDKLPKEGETGRFPAAWEIAQSGLRYIGRYQDKESFDKLLKQFKRRTEPPEGDAKLDVSVDGLSSGGRTELGMVLRGIDLGAADGLGEWGDPKASKPLMEFIEDTLSHEEARQAACSALAWTADADTIKEVAKRAIKYAGDKDQKKQFIGGCYATTLSQNVKPEAASDLIDLITPDLSLPVQLALAEAIGAAPLTPENVAKLREKLKVDETRNAAALALIMGGDEDIAAQTVGFYGTLPPEALDALKDSYFRAFGFWSDEDLKRGNIYRWVDNAESIAIVKVRDAPQQWATARLSDQFDNLVFDNGPHSQTRIVLRYFLNNAAKTADDKTKAEAIRTLKFMKEQGSLMSLRHEKGSTGDLAEKAFHEFMNPVLIETAEDVAKLQQEQAGKMRGQEK